MDYYFFTVAEFMKKIDKKEFVEWEEVYENQFYGTLKSEVDRIWSLGKHVIFDIDVKGAHRIKRKFGDKALTVFVKPPTFEDLKNRLISRKTEDEESLKKRIERVREEMTYERFFDVTLINQHLDEALTNAEQIVDDFLAMSTNKIS